MDLPTSDKLYQHISTNVNIPDVKNGIYVLIASNEKTFIPKESLINGLIINFTRIMLLGITGIYEKEDNVLLLLL